MPFFQLVHVGFDAARFHRALVVLELQHLHHVDRGQPAADHHGLVRRLVFRPGVILLVLVVVPVDERILVREPFAQELFGYRYADIAVAPRAVRQDDRGEAPIFAKILELDVAPEFGRRNEENIRLSQTRVDSPVFLFSLLDVPSRQSVFNLPVRPLVLIDHGNADSSVRQYFRRHGPGYGSANDRYKMLLVLRHGFGWNFRFWF